MQQVESPSPISKTDAVERDHALNVLVVEDSPTQAKLLSISLRRLGIEVEYAGSLEDTVTRLAKPGIDIVLLDLSLPDSAGLATFYTVRAFDLSLPIVVLTGLDDQKVALEAMKNGAQDYLVKGRASEDSIVRCLHYAIERNRVEAALRESERRTRLVIEHSLDAFVAMAPTGKIVEWNKQAESTFGWSREEAVGEQVNDLFDPMDAREKRSLNLEAMLSDGHGGTIKKRIEISALHKSGRRFPAELGLFRVGERDSYLYCAFINDITERVESERRRRQINEELEKRVQERTAELSRSNEELQQFAKIASHDLQEPLRAVEGFATLLTRRYKGKLDKDGDDFIEFILDGTQRMQRLIQAVLEHSRIRTGDTELPVINLTEVLKEVLSNLNQSIVDSQATIEFGDLPSVAVQRSQLIQLFQNLISNAIKYRSTNPPYIKITAELNVGEWLFSMQDNGIGIDPKFAEKIFDMFARLHGGTKYEGTGMGLAICKKIVNVHGGRIWMESEPNEGSIFFFTLPAANTAKESGHE